MDPHSSPSVTTTVNEPPRVGDDAPWADGLVTQDGRPIALRKLRGHQVLLHFHPHEYGPLCPVEGYNFLERHGISGLFIFGIDLNGTDSQLSFTQQYGPIFAVLVDPGHRLAQAYGALPAGNGRPCCTSFLIGGAGDITHRWHDVDQDLFWSQVRELTISTGRQARQR